MTPAHGQTLMCGVRVRMLARSTALRHARIRLERELVADDLAALH